LGSFRKKQRWFLPLGFGGFRRRRRGVDAIIHFAGSIIVPESVADPGESLYSHSAPRDQARATGSALGSKLRGSRKLRREIK